MNIFKSLPFDIIEYIMSYSSTYYRENYKNRKGMFYKQLKKSSISAVSNVYVPIKCRKFRERFTYHTTHFWERMLGGKYILYVEDNHSDPYSDIDENENEPDLEWLYNIEFCRILDHPHRGYGIREEHSIDLSKVYCEV